MTQEPGKPSDGKVSTTITMPAPLADEVKAKANTLGIGWTQMMVVLIKRGLDADAPKG